MRRSYWLFSLGILLAIVGLPLAGHWARRGLDNRCAFDGSKIEPLYRVRIVDDEGRDQQFCCVRCAEWWLQRRSAPPRAIQVTDECSGQEIDAAAAYYVRSLVVTTPTTGNRIHVFRNPAEADKHAHDCRGRLLLEFERPFP